MNSIDWSQAPEGFPLWLEDLRQADVNRSCWAREGKGEYEFPNGGFWTYSVEGFQYRVHRPALILEQTAAHAREVAVSEMLRTPKTPLPEATAYALYDAGYRKVQP